MTDTFLIHNVYDAAGRLFTALAASDRREDQLLAQAIEERYTDAHLREPITRECLGGTLVARLRQAFDTPQPGDAPVQEST